MTTPIAYGIRRIFSRWWLRPPVVAWTTDPAEAWRFDSEAAAREELASRRHFHEEGCEVAPLP